MPPRNASGYPFSVHYRLSVLVVWVNFLTDSTFCLMKNLLLIFFLGFALFWVGCENVAHEQFIPSVHKISNTVRSEMQESECGHLVDIEYVKTSSTVDVTYTFHATEGNNDVSVGSRTEFDIFVNDVVVPGPAFGPPHPTLVVLEDCVLPEDNVANVSIKDFFFDGCPYEIRTVVRFYDYVPAPSGGGHIPVEVHSESETYSVFSFFIDEVCENGPTPCCDECYDEFGNIVLCDG